MNKQETRALIRAFIEEEILNKRAEFRALGSGKKRYTEEQKEYSIQSPGDWSQGYSQALTITQEDYTEMVKSEGNPGQEMSFLGL